MERNIMIAKELVRIANEIVATPNSDQNNDVSTNGSNRNHDWLIKNGYDFFMSSRPQYEKTEEIGNSISLLHWVAFQNDKIISAVYIKYKEDDNRTVKIALSSGDLENDKVEDIINKTNQQAAETLNTILSKIN